MKFDTKLQFSMECKGISEITSKTKSRKNIQFAPTRWRAERKRKKNYWTFQFSATLTFAFANCARDFHLFQLLSCDFVFNLCWCCPKRVSICSFHYALALQTQRALERNVKMSRFLVSFCEVENIFQVSGLLGNWVTKVVSRESSRETSRELSWVSWV